MNSDSLKTPIRFRVLDWHKVEVDDSVVAICAERPAWVLCDKEGEDLLRSAVAAQQDTGYFTAADVAQRISVEQGQAEESLRSLQEAGLVVESDQERRESVPDHRVEHLYFELLATCNLKCKHCYMEGSPARTERLSFKNVVSALEDFKKKGGRYVTFAGGEPLLYSELLPLLEHVQKLGLKGSLVTNGLLLDQNWCEAIAAYDFSISISLDGSTQETNDSIRGKGFSKVVAAIRLAVSHFGSGRVTMSFTPVGSNFHEISSYIDLAISLGVKRLNISIFEEVGRAVANPEFLKFPVEQRAAFVEELYNKAVSVSGEIDIDFNDTRHILSIFATKSDPKLAHPLWKSIRVDSDGNVYPSSLGCASEFLLGNIFNERLSVIVENQMLKDLADDLLARHDRIEECSTCGLRQICRGGSASSAYYANGTIYSTDSYCEGYKRTYPQIMHRLASLAT